MKVAVSWCLHNLSKAYRYHSFNGSIEQFKEVMKKAKELNIEFTKNIPEEVVNEILNETK
jgi:hypothetical protein